MALDPKFKLGRVVMTVEAHDLFKTQQIDVANYLDRHAAGDCPELSDRDQDTNDYGIELEARVMSVYTIPHRTDNGATKIWIITDSGHLQTTILVPGNY